MNADLHRKRVAILTAVARFKTFLVLLDEMLNMGCYIVMTFDDFKLCNGHFEQLFPRVAAHAAVSCVDSNTVPRLVG